MNFRIDSAARKLAEAAVASASARLKESASSEWILVTGKVTVQVGENEYDYSYKAIVDLSFASGVERHPYGLGTAEEPWSEETGSAVSITGVVPLDGGPEDLPEVNAEIEQDALEKARQLI